MFKIPVFIVHYKKLTERKEYLDKALKDNGFLNIHWFEDIDRDTMTQEQLNMYQYNPKKWMLDNATWEHYQSPPRQLALPEIACAVTHIEIYKYIVEHNIETALVLEDDCKLLDGFYPRFKRLIKEFEETKVDLCFINDSFGWTVEKHTTWGSKDNKIFEGKYMYKMGCGKCAFSFLISKEGAKSLLDNFIPFCLPTDWQQSAIFKKQNMRIYWAEPSLTKEGSVEYGSSIKEHIKNN